MSTLTINAEKFVADAAARFRKLADWIERHPELAEMGRYSGDLVDPMGLFFPTTERDWTNVRSALAELGDVEEVHAGRGLRLVVDLDGRQVTAYGSNPPKTGGI